MTTATKGIMAAAFTDQGFRDGEWYIQPCLVNDSSCWDDANGMELRIDGTTTLIGNGESYDGYCVRLVGPGGWYLCVPVEKWESLGFSVPTE